MGCRQRPLDVRRKLPLAFDLSYGHLAWSSSFCDYSGLVFVSQQRPRSSSVSSTRSGLVQLVSRAYFHASVAQSSSCLPQLACLACRTYPIVEGGLIAVWRAMVKASRRYVLKTSTLRMCSMFALNGTINRDGKKRKKKKS